jgi:hypothetical protein
MRRPHVVAHRVRVGPRDHLHAERAAAGHERAERIGVAQPGAPVMERDLRGVVGDDAAGAEGGCIRMQAAEIVEPEIGVESAGIVLDERELHPPHRPIEPAVHVGEALSARGLAPPLESAVPQQRRPNTGARGDLQKVASGQMAGHAADSTGL